MRIKLKEIEGERIYVTGTVSRFGEKQNYRGMPSVTVCLNSLKNKSGDELTDHIWFVVRKTIEGLKLQVGDIVEFEARVKSYMKGYMGYREDVFSPVKKDYKLSHPTKFKKIGFDDREREYKKAS